MANDAPHSTKPIEKPDVKGEDGEDEDDEDESDYDLCPTFCTTEVPEDVLNFVLETVSHGFGVDFIDDQDVFCDQCTEVIFGRFYHCDICNDGDFDLCVDCKKKGKHCDVKDHTLEECGTDIDDYDEIDEAVRSDAGKEDAAEKVPKKEKADNAAAAAEEDDEDAWEDEDSEDGLDGESPLYVVTSLEPDVSQIKLRSRAPMETFDSPFKGWSAEKLYDFWKAKLRRAEDEVCATNLSAFTFVILDEETVRTYQAAAAAFPTPAKKDGEDNDEDDEELEAIKEKLEKTTVLVCTDAPDFGEAETDIKFKTVRMSLAEAATAITAFEVLAICPSEFGKEEVLSVMPPPTFDMENVEDEEDAEDKIQTLGGLVGLVSKPATPRKARENKRKAIIESEQENA